MVVFLAQGTVKTHGIPEAVRKMRIRACRRGHPVLSGLGTVGKGSRGCFPARTLRLKENTWSGRLGAEYWPGHSARTTTRSLLRGAPYVGTTWDQTKSQITHLQKRKEKIHQQWENHLQAGLLTFQIVKQWPEFKFSQINSVVLFSAVNRELLCVQD